MTSPPSAFSAGDREIGNMKMFKKTADIAYLQKYSNHVRTAYTHDYFFSKVDQI